MSDGLIKTLADYIKFKEKQMSYSESDDYVELRSEDVFDVLSSENVLDMYSRDRADWLDKISRYDVYSELVIEIAKCRKNPAFKELVSIIEAAIEAEIEDDENDWNS